MFTAPLYTAHISTRRRVLTLLDRKHRPYTPVYI